MFANGSLDKAKAKLLARQHDYFDWKVLQLGFVRFHRGAPLFFSSFSFVSFVSFFLFFQSASPQDGRR
jgi:hypothetical protein